jgi:glucosamine--fructose-6-phosphate aminotransferase (isomerizing)
MCGIFGILSTGSSALDATMRESLLEALYKLSESRGKESAGIHVALPQTHQSWTLKSAVPASRFIASKPYKSLMQTLRDAPAQPLAILAHSRLVTNGSAAEERNNQPVSRDAITIVHNGIIVNVDGLWKAHPQLKRHAEVDTEVAAALLAQEPDAVKATKQLYAQMRGAASIAWVRENDTHATLATNTGDLYYAYIAQWQCLIFASERYILSTLLAKHPSVAPEIAWLAPDHLMHISLSDLHITHDQWQQTQLDGRSEHHFPVLLQNPANESLLRYNANHLAALKRCTTCVLPETFPFIHFDDAGVCNYCHGYSPKYAGKDLEKEKRAFVTSLEKYRSAKGEPDVIVPFSGGRDSSYGLHLIKKEFGFNPVTFTYDWGMVTDLARRNIARICGELGVQNILVSANIKTKRENIRRNVSAWLAKPDLGLVPLFMAGDKHFFKVTNQIKRQTGIKLDLWCANPLENTDFKSGFCGVEPDFDKHRLDYLSMNRKLRMIGYYGKAFMKNPRYINYSLIDTANAFMAYYIEPRHDFFFMFNHMGWDEGTVNDVLLNQYDWEISPDSPSTWRIGDGTAPFYNYIYVTANGFSEFDTFRSNQIREGMISREEALKNVLIENRPRVESLRWYLETIGLEFDSTIARINSLDWRGLHAAS